VRSLVSRRTPTGDRKHPGASIGATHRADISVHPMLTQTKSFFELIADDARVFGRERLSVAFCLMALLGLNKFSAVFLYRVQSLLFGRRFPLSTLAKLAGRWNSLCNSCEFSAYAMIGRGLHIPHPIGIVVGAITAGPNLTILQNASLALKDRSLPDQDRSNYPHLGANVTIGPGASVLGRIVIGDGVLVGANAVVLKDLPPGSRAVGNPARVLLTRAISDESAS
jgi:serine O-acetyltransferase